MLSHRESYPAQYTHPLVGKRVNVVFKDKITATGVVERIVQSRFGPLVKLDSNATTFYALQQCEEAK